jgi:hypothetical protein
VRLRFTEGPLRYAKPEETLVDRFHRRLKVDPMIRYQGAYQTEAIGMEVIEFRRDIQLIYKITDTENSCRNTLTPMSDEDEKRASMQSLEYESCSWVTLLKALQEQEKTSRAWDNSFYQ